MKTSNNKDNHQPTLFNFFKPKEGTGEENRPIPIVSTLDSIKPTKITEDLDPGLVVKSVELPTLAQVPTVDDALSVQDNMKLWTVLGFLEDHAKGYLGSDMIIPDLGKIYCLILDNFKDMVLNCKERFRELLVIYEAMYHGVKRPHEKKEYMEDLVIPEILSRHFMAEGEEKWGEMLSNTEFVDLHPHSHIDILSDLLDQITDSNSFREHVSSLEDILFQLKSERERRIALKESCILMIQDLDSKILDISEELKALNTVEGVIDLDEEEFIVRSRSKLRRDAEEEEKRRETINSLVNKRELLETKREQAVLKVADVDEFIKNERPEKEVADLRLRGKPSRFCGYDRNGKLYWRLPISTERKIEGLIIESVIYYIYENNDSDSVQIIQGKPIQKKQLIQKKKEVDESSDISYYHPSDNDLQSVDESSDIVLDPDVSAVRLEVKSIFEYIDSHSTLMDLQNALNVNGVRENNLKRVLKHFISENQDSLFGDDKEKFMNTFLDWILSRDSSKRKMEISANFYKDAVLQSIHQLLPYILVGVNMPVPASLPVDLSQCLLVCETLKDTQFYRNRQLYKELASIRTNSAMIHWLQRAESYVAYLIQKEEIKELRQEKKEARELSSVASSSRQNSTQKASDSVTSEASGTSKQARKSFKSKSSLGKGKNSENSRFRRSSRNTDRKDYTLKLEITSSESSESSGPESELDPNRRTSQRVRLKKMRHLESSESEESSEDELVVRCNFFY